MKTKNIIILIASILICQFAGIIGSLFTAGSISTWYSSLVKVSFNPPGWIFGPVWILLYLLMGISLYFIWIKKSKFRKQGLIFFGIQLILNSLWSIIFFGFHAPFIALIEMLLLWLFILLTIIKFYKISKTSALLLIPYLFWVSFAFILNLFIVILN